MDEQQLELPFFKVLLNNVILNEILKFLSTNHILRLSQTSKVLCQEIRASPGFQSRLRLSLTPLMSRSKFEGLATLPFQWKRCTLEVDGWFGKENEFRIILDLLGSVTSLELITEKETCERRRLEAICPKDLAKIILSTRRLKSLTFGAQLACRGLAQLFTTEMLNHLHHLTELHFIHEGMNELLDPFIPLPNPQPGIHVNYFHLKPILGWYPFSEILKQLRRDIKREDRSSILPPFPTGINHRINTQIGNLRRQFLTCTMTKLLSLSPLPKLTSFTFQHFRTDDSKLKELFLTFILAYAWTLEKLTLDSEIWSLDKIHVNHFPRLKHLVVSVNGSRESVHVASFIKRHFHLETLVVSDVLETAGDTRPRPGCSVLDAIADECTELRRLELVMQTPMSLSSSKKPNWKFLRKCTHLHSFGLEYVKVAPPWMDLNQILSFLPGGVKRIRVCGVPRKRLYDDNANRLTTQSLLLLPHLESLDLWRCRNALDNQMLEIIFTELPHLRLLAFSDCEGVSGRRIVGNEKRNVFGIHSLPKLEELRIGDCRNLPLEVLLESISIPSLQRLKLNLKKEAFSESDVIRIIRQNPGLKIFNFNMDNAFAMRESFVYQQIRLMKREIKLHSFLNL